MRDEVIKLLTKALLRQSKWLDAESAKYQANVMLSEVEYEAKKGQRHA